MRPVFIGGCPRSGTTLLGAMLGAHSQCLCVPEMPFKFQMLLRLDREGTGTVSLPAVAKLLRGRFKFEAWNVSLDRIFDRLSNSSPSTGSFRSAAYREVVEALVGDYADVVGQTTTAVWVDHTPFNIRHVHKLAAYFPDAVFLHLIRDGRGVASSLLRVDFGPNNILDAARSWAEWLGFGLAAEQWDPQRVVRVHFEELVRNPVDVMADLSSRLDLQWEPQMGMATDFRLPDHTRDFHSLVAGPPDSTRANAWEKQLGPRQVELFESVAEDLLESLGYAVHFGQRARRPNAFEKAEAGVQRIWREVPNFLKRKLRRSRS